MVKVLIATVYGPDPVLVASNKLGPDRLILLVDIEKSKEQEKSVELIKNSLGRVIDVKVVKTSVYNIVDIAKKVVDVIDMQPKDDEIYVNITSGRKTKAIGLLFGAYARHEKVKKIAYNPEEKGSIPIYLPKMQFNLTVTQKQILEILEKGSFENLSELSEKVDQSTAMLYRNIKELKDKGLIEDLKLTDAGKIAML
jgi:CRISPR-associated protein Csa3